MKNKLLKRLLKKNLSVNSRVELAQKLSTLLDSSSVNAEELSHQKQILSDLISLFDVIDQALTDFDRVIEIRDRSLAISSKEMTDLASEIAAHAESQEKVILRLQSTVNLLIQQKATGSISENKERNTENLIATVEQLVRSQMNFMQLQKSLYEEGVRICSVLSFKNLEAQVRNSFKNLMQIPVDLKMYFCGNLFESMDPIEFYLCDDLNTPLPDHRLSKLVNNTNSRLINVESPVGNGVLATIELSLVSQPGKIIDEELWNRVTPLVPSIAATLENIKLLRDEKHMQHMAGELNTIRIVQKTLLPPESPTTRGNELEISGYYQSATECGGDWWTYFPTTEGKHIILVGDVTGHGTGSAMVCAVVKGFCDSLLHKPNLECSAILKEINTVIYRMAKHIERAMTMSAVIIDTHNNRATFANAGHPLPILTSKSTTSPESKFLVNHGAILGINESAQFSEIEFEFGPEDQLTFYTDGLIEAVNSQTMMYGQNKLRRFIQATSKINQSASLMNKAIVDDVKLFSTGETFEDDLTVVVVKNKFNTKVNVSTKNSSNNTLSC